ncbi:MAG: efflux RND transporter periplasmic adaptor subunit [Gammaproteobacteria bacterium]|nr:efflux RND transporter periplasmic adaptor subunit [Gammaproteobacteria bacterium]MBQ0839196.1 efflux RND transporter periplasmic adaptor subunit [Gammaproteobacteria bacterium]
MAAWFVATLTACGFERAGSSRELAQRVRPAKLITVGQGGEPESLNFPAVVQSSQQTEMSFEVGGMLNELFAVEGSRVQKGEVLAKLDQRDLQAKQSSAQAQFKHANTEYQRALRLIKAKAISRSILEQREYQYDVSKLQLKTARKALQDSILRAPFSGAISRVSVEAREVVRAGEPAITILGQGQLEAKLNLPSQIMANAGDSGKPQLEGYLVLDVAPQKRIPATFKSVSLEADTASQTYEVTFTFAEPDGLMILPGMNGVVWLRAPQSEVETLAGLSIPLASIATDGEQHYVWVVNSRSMRLSRRNIVLEEGVGARLNVITGLEVQEIIVAAGISYLSEGMKIRPWSN